MNKVLEEPKKQANAVAGIVVYLALFVGLWYGLDWWMNYKVGADAVDKYEIAMRNGDRQTACFQAGMAASAHLSAKAEEAYKKWRAIEIQTCGK